jgi:ubiquinone/menaquinone biosynthesis C-methylase UbiE
MDNTEQLKQVVKEKYGAIAGRNLDMHDNGCCGVSCGCATTDAANMAEDYGTLEGYVSEADLGLGCGLPTEFADIKKGDTVVDLGSGAGNDAFVAGSLTGSQGRVIGIDFTEKMISRARASAEKLGYSNVEFRQGDIEDIPLRENIADVVVSNCVMNLVPDKAKAFNETFRILKPGGHFSISDIVVKGELPAAIRRNAEMFAGCVSGALDKDQYLGIVKAAGFTSITVQKERKIAVPEEFLSVYLNSVDLLKYKSEASGIFSITVYAEKPVVPEKKESCCDPGCCGK